MQSRLHIDDYFAEKPIYFGQVKAYFQMFIYINSEIVVQFPGLPTHVHGM